MPPKVAKSTSSSPRVRGRKTSRNQVTRHELTGGKLSVPPNPPSVTYQPWNHLTVVQAGSASSGGEITVKVSDLVDLIQKQIDPIKTGLATAPILNVKLQRVRAWNITGHMIALSVDDFSDAAKAIADVDALCGLVDTGSTNHTPAVGYDLPNSHKNIVLRNGTSSATDKKAVLYHVMAPAADTIIIYTTVLWKFDGPSKFSTFNSTMLQAIESIAENVQGVGTNLSVLQETVERIDSRSSKLAVGNAIVDSVKVVAPFVIPAAGIQTGNDAQYERIISALKDDKSVPALVKEWLDDASQGSYERVNEDDF